MGLRTYLLSRSGEPFVLVLELARFRGHVTLREEGVHDAESAPIVPAGVLPALGGGKRLRQVIAGGMQLGVYPQRS